MDRLTPKTCAISPLQSTLTKLDPGMGYCDWIIVLMGIFNETRGSDAGLTLADQWSSGGHNYRGLHDIERHWSRFNISHKNPVRIGSLIRMAEHRK